METAFFVFPSAVSILGLVGEIPKIEVSCPCDIHSLVPIDTLGVVGRKVIIRVGIRVIPNDGDIALSERAIIASPYWTVPCTIIWFKIKIAFGDVVA